MNVVYPERLWLFGTLFLFAGVFLLASSKRRQRLQVFASLKPRVLSRKMDILKSLLWLLGLSSLYLALMQPRWGFEDVELPQPAHDMMIVMDLSQSMLAEDIQPNRLERARRETLDLLGFLKGHRVGLVVFAGETFVHCPLTQDYGLVKDFIRQWSYDLPAIQGSLLGSALELAGERLLNVKGERHRTILLLTDGEDHEGKAVKVATSLGEKGIVIHTIGMGETQSLIPEPSGGYKKDRAGHLIVSRLDEDVLRKVSQVTKGQYVRSRGDEFDLIQIFKSLDTYQNDNELQNRRVWHERFQWFLGIALFLFLLEPWIPTTLLMLFLCLNIPGHVEAQSWSPGEKGSGLWYHNLGDFDKAIQTYKEELSQQPQNMMTRYNLGVSQFQSGRFEDAKQSFQEVQGENIPLFQQAQFNLGNTYVALGRLEEAAQVYQNLQQKGLQDEAVDANLKWVLEQLQKKQDKQQQDQDKQQQDQDKQQQDQDKQQQDQDKQQQDPSSAEQNNSSQEQQQNQEDSKNQSQDQASDRSQNESEEQEQKEAQQEEQSEQDQSNSDKEQTEEAKDSEEKSESSSKESQEQDEQKSHTEETEKDSSLEQLDDEKSKDNEKLESAATQSEDEKKDLPQGSIKEQPLKNQEPVSHSESAKTPLQTLEQREALRLLKKVGGQGVIKYRRRQQQTAPTKDW